MPCGKLQEDSHYVLENKLNSMGCIIVLHIFNQSCLYFPSFHQFKCVLSQFRSSLEDKNDYFWGINDGMFCFVFLHCSINSVDFPSLADPWMTKTIICFIPCDVPYTTCP